MYSLRVLRQDRFKVETLTSDSFVRFYKFLDQSTCMVPISDDVRNVSTYQFIYYQVSILTYDTSEILIQKFVNTVPYYEF